MKFFEYAVKKKISVVFKIPDDSCKFREQKLMRIFVWGSEKLPFNQN